MVYSSLQHESMYYIILQHAVMVMDEGNNNMPQDLQAPSNHPSLIRSFMTMTCRDPEDDKHAPCTGAPSRPFLTIYEVLTNTVLDRFANNI